ncbi:MAG TPA: ABC transporter permease, partial [Candidatus Sumerlaeota bacterium]|nr:ABC transporter permease [Candidatus Sumerlaeota bacterium]
MRQIYALAVKDFRLMWHDPAAVFFAVFFPVLLAVFFGAIYSGFGSPRDRGISVALVDEDNTEGSRKFVSTLKDAPELGINTEYKADDESMKPIDITRARDLVRRGKVTAFIALKPGFGAARMQMFSGSPPEIETGIDPSRKASAAMLEGILTRLLFKDMQEAFQNPKKMREQIISDKANLKNVTEEELGFNPAILDKFLNDLDQFMTVLPENSEGGKGWQPVKISKTEVKYEWDGPASSHHVTFPQAVIWAMLACAATFGTSLITERTRGTLTRLCAAPMGRAHILAGKSLACFSVTFGLALLLLMMARIVYGVRPVSWSLLLLALFCSSLCYVGLMMGFSVLGKTERSASGWGWAILLTLSMIGGGSIPVFFMPQWLSTVSNISPVKWSILAIEGALWRGFTLQEMAMPCGILLGVGCVFFVLGVWAFN